jgi:hypothetical protein
MRYFYAVCVLLTGSFFILSLFSMSANIFFLCALTFITIALTVAVVHEILAGGLEYYLIRCPCKGDGCTICKGAGYYYLREKRQ